MVSVLCEHTVEAQVTGSSPQLCVCPRIRLGVEPEIGDELIDDGGRHRSVRLCTPFGDRRTCWNGRIAGRILSQVMLNFPIIGHIMVETTPGLYRVLFPDMEIEELNSEELRFRAARRVV
jgi:hypothetical protein